VSSKGDIQGAASSDQPVLGNLFTIPQSQWFRQARAGQTYYGTVQLSPQNEPYLILSVPLPDGAVAAGRLRMNILQNVVSNIHFGSNRQCIRFQLGWTNHRSYQSPTGPGLYQHCRSPRIQSRHAGA